MVEITNSWIIEGRKLPVTDLFQPLWCKNVDLHFHRFQEVEKYNQAAAVLNEDAVELLKRSVRFRNHRLWFAEPYRASVLSYPDKWQAQPERLINPKGMLLIRLCVPAPITDSSMVVCVVAMQFL